MVCSSSWKDCN